MIGAKGPCRMKMKGNEKEKETEKDAVNKKDNIVRMMNDDDG